MTSDINGTVVAIQGNAVSSIAPTDGYVLVWDGADGYWIPQPPTGLRKAYFTSNGTWTAPAGITNILLVGCGGGGSGGSYTYPGGGTAYGNGAGGGALQSTIYATVVPGTTYTITVGAGGAGTTNNSGNDGSNTTFGSLATFVGGGSGGVWQSINPGISVKDASWLPQSFANNVAPYPQPAMGGCGLGTVSNNNAGIGQLNSINAYAGGSAGTTSGNYGGGGGGGAGPQGAGGSGGNGNNAGVGGNGTAAAANTGAGGGGGGGGTTGNPTSGAGGSGYLYVIW